MNIETGDVHAVSCTAKQHALHHPFRAVLSNLVDTGQRHRL